MGRVINNFESIDGYTIEKAYLNEPYFKEFLLNNKLQVILLIANYFLKNQY